MLTVLIVIVSYVIWLYLGFELLNLKDNWLAKIWWLIGLAIASLLAWLYLKFTEKPPV